MCLLSIYLCIFLYVYLLIHFPKNLHDDTVSLCLPYLLTAPGGSTHTCPHITHAHTWLICMPISIHRNLCFFTQIFVYKEIREKKLGKEQTPIMLLTQKKELCPFLKGNLWKEPVA